MLCGMQEIDVDDWQTNSVYRHYTRNSKQGTKKVNLIMKTSKNRLTAKKINMTETEASNRTRRTQK